MDANYKSLCLDMSKPILETNVMMKGPFIGLTGYSWHKASTG